VQGFQLYNFLGAQCAFVNIFFLLITRTAVLNPVEPTSREDLILFARHMSVFVQDILERGSCDVRVFEPKVLRQADASDSGVHVILWIKSTVQKQMIFEVNVNYEELYSHKEIREACFDILNQLRKQAENNVELVPYMTRYD